MSTRRSPGDGAIYQLKSGPRKGKWVARYEAGGENEGRKRRYFYGKTREEVKQRLQSALRKGLKRGAVGAPKTLQELVEAWIDDRESRGRRPRTIEGYRDIADHHLTPAIGSARLDRFEPADVAALDVRLRKAGAGTRTRELAYVILKATLRMAVRRQWIDRNPADGVDRPDHDGDEMLVLNELQAQRFLEFVRGDWYEALFVLGLHLGLRPGEMFGLQWADVDLVAGEIVVQRTQQERKSGQLVLGPVKTKGSRRRLTLPATARDALAAAKQFHFSQGVRSKWVFPDTQGGPSRSRNVRNRHFHPAIERANEERIEDAARRGVTYDPNDDALRLPVIRLYDLRHTFATLQLLAGTPLKVVSEILGHASVKITADTYMHVLPGMQRDAALRIDEILRPLPAPRAVL